MTVHSPVSTAEAVRALREALGDRILVEEEVRAQFRSAFGRMADNLPGAVARCTNAQDVAAVVRACRERGIPVAPRGHAHSQSAQATPARGVRRDPSASRT